MKCKLTKLYSVHKNLRTKEVIGECRDEPEVGRRFGMIAPPVDPEAFMRGVLTTPVLQVIEVDGTIEFKTVNSDYRWESL